MYYWEPYTRELFEASSQSHNDILYQIHTIRPAQQFPGKLTLEFFERSNVPKASKTQLYSNYFNSLLYDQSRICCYSIHTGLHGTQCTVVDWTGYSTWHAILFSVVYSNLVENFQILWTTYLLFWRFHHIVRKFCTHLLYDHIASVPQQNGDRVVFFSFFFFWEREVGDVTVSVLWALQSYCSTVPQNQSVIPSYTVHHVLLLILI